MIYVSTAERPIVSLIESSPILSTGMDFLRLMDEQYLIEGSVESAIVGGAVRDVFFHSRAPHDIDVFLYKAPTTSQLRGSTLAPPFACDFELAKENIILWLEDNDIEYQSLLSDRAASYFGGNRFLEILDFNWRGVQFQIMIPDETFEPVASGLDWLLGTMPTYSKLALTLDYFYASNGCVASQFMVQKPVCIEADILYLRNKFPDERFIRFSNSTDLIYYALNSYVPTSNISTLERGVMPERLSSPSDLLKIACSSRLGEIQFGVLPRFINPRRPELSVGRPSMISAFESGIVDGLIRNSSLNTMTISRAGSNEPSVVVGNLF